MNEVRQPAVAGRFYPSAPEQLRTEIRACMGATGGETSAARAVVVPHAGYLYSGPIAGRTFADVEVPARVVVLCPNHTGRGERRSIWSRGAWQIPGARLEVDSELSRRIATYAALEPDREAHLGEHAIEVELPFLHARRSDVRIVPICLGHLALDECRSVGEGIARAIAEDDTPTLLVASTDMSHYVAAGVAERLDTIAISAVLALDPDGLYGVVTRYHISMCGFVPTTIALFASRALGANGTRLVEYGNSGRVSGDHDRVVGYAGLVIS